MPWPLGSAPPGAPLFVEQVVGDHGVAPVAEVHPDAVAGEDVVADLVPAVVGGLLTRLRSGGPSHSGCRRTRTRRPRRSPPGPSSAPRPRVAASEDRLAARDWRGRAGWRGRPPWRRGRSGVLVISWRRPDVEPAGADLHGVAVSGDGDRPRERRAWGRLRASRSCRHRRLRRRIGRRRGAAAGPRQAAASAASSPNRDRRHPRYGTNAARDVRTTTTSTLGGVLDPNDQPAPSGHYAASDERATPGRSIPHNCGMPGSGVKAVSKLARRVAGPGLHPASAHSGVDRRTH